MNALNLPKLCGGDIELANFLTGVDAPRGTGSRAATALLDQIKGIAGRSRGAETACDCAACRARRGGSWTSSVSSSGAHAGASEFDPQDWRRTFLPGNGGCAYIDLDHLELCLPEVLSARDHVAAWHALLRIAARAQADANAELPEGQRIHVLANNSDGRGNSYGSHLDFLITRRAWNNIFHRRLQHLLYLAAYQASSIVFAGQGKVGSENGAVANPCDYQLSQRADFIEVLMGVQTTFNRPLINSRDEALTGVSVAMDSPAQTMARLHVIFYDSTLCHVAGLLKVGVMQIILAMIEAEKINPHLILDDPVAAVHVWSRDPLLSQRAALVSGQEVTAVELQLRFLDEAKAFVDGGGCDDIVPEAEMIIELWADTLEKLRARNLSALAPRIDWVQKLALLQRALQQRTELGWDSPQIKHLDHLYSALDGGLYQACERHGAVERLVSDAEIQRFMDEPPEDTRAYARSWLLRLAGPQQIEQVDWDEITFRLDGAWPSRCTVSLANPLGFTKEKVRFLETASLDDALDILGTPPAHAATPLSIVPVRPQPQPSTPRPKPPTPYRP